MTTSDHPPDESTTSAPPAPIPATQETADATNPAAEGRLGLEAALLVQKTMMALAGSEAEVSALLEEPPGRLAALGSDEPSVIALASYRRALLARLERTKAPRGDGVSGEEATRAALATLRPSEREALVYGFLTELDAGAIAALCGTKPDEVERRQSRGLVQLAGLSLGSTPECQRLAEVASRLARGKLSKAAAEHVLDCDACRDLRHEVSRWVERLAHAADDLRSSPERERALSAAVVAHDERRALLAEAARSPAAAETPSAEVREGGKRPLLYAVFGALGLALLFGAMAIFAERPQASELAAGGARVERLSGGPEGTGLRTCPPTGSPCRRLARGDRVTPGSRVETDDSTRADIELNAGIRLLVERNTQFVLSAKGAASIELLHGVVVADVAPGEELGLELGHGGGKLGPGTFHVRTSGDEAVIEVTRGGAQLFGKSGSTSAGPGELARLGKEGVRVARSPALGAFGLGERAEETTEVSSRGLGELRAKKPGTDAELEGSVRLTSHAVRVRIAGAVARTEIEEVFENGTDQILEGIYRFPLPADAQIERLALEVDGKLLEGAFVDRDRAAAIWRGAIVNSAKSAPRPREEIVWVPGPWRDPALLEWQRGGRFELRIFPIPARGSRRIVLAYTQLLAPVGDARRYTYPLAYDPSGTTRIGDFSFDVKVRGHDRAFGVQTYGYEPARRTEDDALALSVERKDFAPSGDLVVEYALPDRSAELKAWAYAGASTGGVAAPAAAAPATAVDFADPFVTLALRPELLRAASAERRAFGVVVDSSRSMFGESYTRAKKLAARMARELDANDRIVLFACDSECRRAPEGLLEPGQDAERKALAFFDTVEPDGASDPTRAVVTAYRALGDTGSRVPRVVYIGDAAPTMGPIRPAEVEAAVQRALPNSSVQLTTVGVGIDADTEILSALARGGGGVVVPYAPGSTLTRAARAVLGAAYGHTLRDVEVRLPDGLYAAAPARLDAIPAGGEAVLAARMSAREVSGDVLLKGRVNGEVFERRYPVRLVASTGDGNAFVPRQYAALRIRDLERESGADAKQAALSLSTRFNVASRHSSLLVLESQAMFEAFGLDNSRSAPHWSGEELPEGETVENDPAWLESKAEQSDAFDALDAPFDFGSADDARRESEGAASGRARKAAPKSSRDFSAEAPAAAAPSPVAPPSRRRPEPFLDAPREVERRQMVPMRRLWERFAEIHASPRLPSSATPEAIARAEREAAENQDRRDALRKLYVSLSLAGELERAERVVERWVSRDPLDPDALTARADLAARRGGRQRAIRLLGSVIDVRPGDVRAQRRLERLQRWAGDAALGCRHLIAASGLHQDDAPLLSDAVRCARDSGEAELAARLLSGASPAAQRAAEARLARKAAVDSELSGDLRIEASWSSGIDLDLALLDPDGHRVSWLGAPTRAVIAAKNVTASESEALSLRGAKPGQYVIELVRPQSSSAAAVSGSLLVSAAGTVRRIPFTLSGTRMAVALVDLKMRSRLVPL